MVECKRSRELKVMPIFYDVTPSEVRNQTGDFADAFVSHEKFYDDETIRVWRNALKEVGNLKGWDIQSDSNRQEGKLVKEVMNKVLRELKKAYLIVTDCLVGVDHHVEGILDKMCAGTSGVGVLGIYGMGGIGKTTLAKVIYNRLLGQFESSTFLANVRETSRSKGMEFLQSQLVSNLSNVGFPGFTNADEGIVTISTRFAYKKVLILLDDVDENFQLQGLVGKRDWFGSGTRIIITTRNKSILDLIQVDWPFELNGMDHPQALQLFSKHAFRDEKPPITHIALSKKIVAVTGGLPLALEVVGSVLCGKSMKYWNNILKKLEKAPQKEVAEKLRISFDSLDERQKQIFLDIACFFIGVDYRVAIHFWDDSELFPEETIEALQQLSLIKVQANNLLWMHDQLRDYGRDIIRQENIIDAGNRSRLWDREEATEVFVTNRGTDKIQGICIAVDARSDWHFKEDAFDKLSKVRLFWVERKDYLEHHHRSFSGEIEESITFSLEFYRKRPHIFSKLRWLSWRHCIYCLQTLEFSLWDLRILDLSYSEFTFEWVGWSQIMKARKLKVLNLTGCMNLVKTPKFSYHLLLERLILEDCFALIEIDESIGMLEHLVHLNLKNCYSLCELPIALSYMESLTELTIDNTQITEIPYRHCISKLEVFSAYGCMSLKNCISLGNLTSLKKLSLEETPITLIPNSIGELIHLLELYLCRCKSLRKLPTSIGGLISLIELDISESRIEELPSSIGSLKNLKLLRMRVTPMKEFPSSIGMAEKLEEIDAEGCKLLRGGLPKLPQSLTNLTIPFKTVDANANLSNLIKLKQLRVDPREWAPRVWAPREWAPVESPSPWWIGRLSKAEKLDLAFSSITTFHPDIGSLSLLTELKLVRCVCLRSIPMLPLNLTYLEFFHCESLEAISDLSHLKELSTLKIIDTPLRKLEGLHCLESLQVLTLDGCMFSEIDGMSENLRFLTISNCRELERLPQMSKYKKVERFNLVNCPRLVEIQGRLESLENLTIHYCQSLVKIPDVVNVKTLCNLFISRCRGLRCGAMCHRGPILTGNFPISESEQSYISNMLKICGYS